MSLFNYRKLAQEKLVEIISCNSVLVFRHILYLAIALGDGGLPLINITSTFVQLLWAKGVTIKLKITLESLQIYFFVENEQIVFIEYTEHRNSIQRGETKYKNNLF